MEFDPRDSSVSDRERERRARQVYRRRMVLGVFLLALIILIIILVIACPGGTDETGTTSTSASQSTSTSLIAATYTAVLTGDDSVPPVKTDSTGKLTLTYDPEVPALTFLLEIDGLTDTTVAAIYEGSPGTNGTAVYTLFAGPTEEGQKYGELASGTIEDVDLTGTLAGQTVGDLIALIREGNAYASVGNKSHPVDAIRGPIR
jgi:hypothetical protein